MFKFEIIELFVHNLKFKFIIIYIILFITVSENSNKLIDQI